MTVYVVIRVWHTNTAERCESPWAAFSTQEKAETYVKAQEVLHGKSFSIKEFTVDG